MTFAYPMVFMLFLGLPLLAAWLYWPRLRRRRTATFLFSATHRLAGGQRSPKVLLSHSLDLLFLAAVALLIIALARPQTVEYEEADIDGIDIYVAFDMSGSMRAIDLDESVVMQMERREQSPPTRFDEAKETLRQFVVSRPHDRIGIVLFAQDAYLQFPLTLDHGLIAEGVAELELGDIEPAGTAIGNAVGRALAGLTHSDAESRIIIMITDGDRRGGNISPMQAAQMAKDMGVRIYPILVGRDGEALVATGRNPFTGRTAYRRAEFPIDPELLQRMADLTGGKYFRAFDGVSMADDLNSILDEYDRSRQEIEGRPRKEEHFAPFALAALILLSLQFFLKHTLCRSFP